MSMGDGLRALKKPGVSNATTVETLITAGFPAGGVDPPETAARKLSAVDRCIEILSDSMAKLPSYVIDTNTRQRKTDHYLLKLLNVRPNEAMTPFIHKKVLETSRLEGGNGYEWLIRNRKTGFIDETIPVPYQLVTPWRDIKGRVWYTIIHPCTGEPMVLPNEDVCHYKGATRNGLVGLSVLRRASEVIAAGRAAQQYDLAYYENGGQPSGILKTDTDLQGYAKDSNGQILKRADGSPVSLKDKLRSEWERTYTGPKNSHRTAILDLGLDYKPLAASNRDAQFVESSDIRVKDIARFFGVPLYKLQEGKQAYGSNEQNAIEYVVGTLHPNVSQYEEERTWKMLTDSDLAAGLEIRINLMAELKGDTGSRGNWYKTMSEVGAFCPNDILALEDMPDIPGGERHKASLNYVPLDMWPELSKQRNGGK